MNDFGLALVWLAVQVALVLVPGLILQSLASRHGAASGAWVATWSLGLVVALSGSIALPWVLPAPSEEPSLPIATAPAPSAGSYETSESSGGVLLDIEPETSRRWSFESLRSVWSRWKVGTAEPASKVRRWGRVLALLALMGTGLGLIRLGLGLWAVRLCRRQGRAVNDPRLLGLVEELREAMGCRSSVVLLEIADLATPATAGWRRPILLLPSDWRSWDELERRAVIAHELAHIIRRDYASGLLSRLAVVLYAYHPLVHWMAGRLHLQQELAADALGAPFAGGRTSYLVALASLALKQEGKSPSWPARAFLPTRRTLIRRIKMLRVKNPKSNPRPVLSIGLKLATALGLIGLTLGVASLKRPVQAADELVAPGAKANPVVVKVEEPFDLSYVPDNMTGIIALRPAAIARRSKLANFTPILRRLIATDLAEIADALKVDPKRPGFVNLACEDIETISFGVNFGRPLGVPKNPAGEDLHAMNFNGCTVRMVAPFDWLSFLKQWNFDPHRELLEPGGIYYKVKDPFEAGIGLEYSFYLPDDRTVVFGEEAWIHRRIGLSKPANPSFLQGADWDRVSRALVAVAVNNKDDAFVKDYDLGRTDDAIVLPLFQGIDRWVIGLHDLDAMMLSAEMTGHDPQAAEGLLRSLKTLVNLGQMSLAKAPGEATEFDPLVKIARSFLTNLQIKREANLVGVVAEGFGTYANVAEFFREAVVVGGLGPVSEAEAARKHQEEAERLTSLGKTSAQPKPKPKPIQP